MVEGREKRERARGEKLKLRAKLRAAGGNEIEPRVRTPFKTLPVVK